VDGARLLLIAGFLGLLCVGVIEIRAYRARPPVSLQEAFYRMDGPDQTDESCEAAGGAAANMPGDRGTDYVDTGRTTIAYRGSECIRYSVRVQDSPTEQRSVPRICCFESLGFTPRR
jgi:hypothetical protein